MDAIIKDKTEKIDHILADLTRNFTDKFWVALEEIYEHTHHLEVEALVWEAIKKKDEFLASI